MFEKLAKKCFFKIFNCNIRKNFADLLNSRSIASVKNTCQKAEIYLLSSDNRR